jgi:hypothetical protein
MDAEPFESDNVDQVDLAANEAMGYADEADAARTCCLAPASEPTLKPPVPNLALTAALERGAALAQRAAPRLARLAPAVAGAIGGGNPPLPAALMPATPAEAEPTDGPEALAEALLGHAGLVDSESEALVMAGGIVALLAGSAPVAVQRVAPVIARGTDILVRALRRHAETRPLTPLAGAIVRQTIASLGGRTAAGEPISAALAAGTMAGQARTLLSRPADVARALAMSSLIRRRLLAGTAPPS